MKSYKGIRTSLERWPRPWPTRTLAVCALMFSVVACSTNLQLKPAARSADVSRKVPLSVQIDHSPNFVNTAVPVDVYGNRHEFIFSIGKASDEMLRATYPRVFEHVSDWVGNYSTRTMPSQSDVILSPKINSFDFPVRGMIGPYFAQITYTFTLSTLDGTKTIEWSVTGEGESGEFATPLDESAAFRLAAEKAIEKAVLKFTRSFEEVPEVKRFLSGMPPDGATADENTQIKYADAQHVNSAKGTYEGVVTVEAQQVRSKDGTEPAYLRATRITILNEGDHRIVFYPSDVRLVYENGQEVPPIRGCVVAASLSTRYLKFPPLPAGVGVASLPLFFTSLANAAMVKREKQDRVSFLRTYQAEELADMTLEHNEASTGILFFYTPVPGQMKAELIVPVVDVEEATRYTVHLPINLQ